MSLHIRLAPGLRVRVGRRGVRVAAGPRITRLHFGAGGAGISAGAGPVSAYKPLRRSKRET